MFDVYMVSAPAIHNCRNPNRESEGMTIKKDGLIFLQQGQSNSRTQYNERDTIYMGSYINWLLAFVFMEDSLNLLASVVIQLGDTTCSYTDT